MFRRILVPVDFTPKNDRALRTAKQMAELFEGEITLVHVVESLEDELDTDLEKFYERLSVRAEERIATALTSLGEGEFARRSTIIVGHRVHAIVEYAEREKFDVIVLSSHRVDPDKPGA